MLETIEGIPEHGVQIGKDLVELLGVEEAIKHCKFNSKVAVISAGKLKDTDHVIKAAVVSTFWDQVEESINILNK